MLLNEHFYVNNEYSYGFIEYLRKMQTTFLIKKNAKNEAKKNVLQK
jgi:hypothetical protein